MQKEYIEREALNKVIDYEIEVCNSGIAKGALEMLKVRVEPAADVVEVVRCKDCVSSRPINMEYWVENAFYKECVWCKWFDTGMLPDEYCSHGKRKEE